jgi:hypothetical protein
MGLLAPASAGEFLVWPAFRGPTPRPDRNDGPVFQLLADIVAKVDFRR